MARQSVSRYLPWLMTAPAALVVWPFSVWASAGFAALFVLGWQDFSQTKQAVRRNYPLTGRMRYGLEYIRPELRQYFLEDDEEKLLDTLRHAHHAEVFRTLVRDIEGELSVEQVADDLSALADATLDCTLRWAWQHLRQRQPLPVLLDVAGRCLRRLADGLGHRPFGRLLCAVALLTGRLAPCGPGFLGAVFCGP